MAELRLTNGGVTLVDDEDLPRVSTMRWRRATHGYVTSTRPPFTYLHRFLLEAPKGMEVDHVNGDRLDNRRANIRLCTRQQNAGNLRKTRPSVSPYKGVVPASDGVGWCVYLKSAQRKRYHGTYPTQEAAALVYDLHARAAWGEFAVLNFPDRVGDPNELAALRRRNKGGAHRRAS